MTANRQTAYERNLKLEALLAELNGLLAPAELQAINQPSDPQYPVVLVMGVARCGSTLMLQWLAASGAFAYPSNLLSRFFEAPYIGARIQQMLVDPQFNFRDELLYDGFSEDFDFKSDLGKSSGLTAPNEFWYFWRRFFQFGEIQRLAPEAFLSGANSRFASELAALERAFGRPFAMKGMIANWNIPELAKLLKRVVFVHVRRDPVANMESLAIARERFFGDRSKWYSFKPPEYREFASAPVPEQLAAQVLYTNQAIEAGMARLSPEHCLTVDYEAFCQSPAAVYDELRQRMQRQGYSELADYRGPQQFQARAKPRLSKAELDAFRKAYNALSTRPDIR